MTPALALVVAFAGVHGPDPVRVERQLAALLHHDEAVESITIAPRQRAALVHHDSGAAGIVQKLHVAGLIAAGLADGPDGTTLTVVVYAGDGHLAQMVETPLDAHVLERADLEVLRSNLVPAVHQLAAAAAAAEPAPDPAPAPAPAPKPAPTPRLQVADAFADPPAPAAPASAPPAAADAGPAVAADEAAPDGAGPEVAAADDGDAVMEDDPADLGTVSSDDDGPPPRLGLRVAVGAGLLGRSFTPGPAAIAGYSSSVVPAVRFAAAAAPTDRLAVAVLAERSLSMSTDLGHEAASTSITRWEASAAYRVAGGAVDVTVTGGLGHRAFQIESKDPMRSPDGDYTYVLAGVDAARPFGRVLVHAAATFLPVIAGAQPTEMAFGSARRWGVDLAVGAAMTFGRLYVEATADYQRFQWTWPAAGDRGAGGAVDSYPTAAVAVGAHY